MTDFLPCKVCKHPTSEYITIEALPASRGIRTIFNVYCSACENNVALALHRFEALFPDEVTPKAIEAWNEENAA